MKYIRIHKAQGFSPSNPPEAATITIVNTVDDGRVTNLDIDFEDEAKELAVTLLDTLPGGTLDRLIIQLLTAKASQLKVAY